MERLRLTRPSGLRSFRQSTELEGPERVNRVGPHVSSSAPAAAMPARRSARLGTRGGRPAGLPAAPARERPARSRGGAAGGSMSGSFSLAIKLGLTDRRRRLHKPRFQDFTEYYQVFSTLSVSFGD